MAKVATRIVILSILLLSAVSAYGSKYEFIIESTDLVVSKPSESAYIIRLRLPENLQRMRINSATLEYYIEASARDSLENTYVLTFAPLEEFSPETGDYSISPGEWPVFIGRGTGENTRVMMDITSVARAWKQGQGECFGGIYRSDGDENVQCNLITGGCGPGAVAIIRIYAINR